MSAGGTNKGLKNEASFYKRLRWKNATTQQALSEVKHSYAQLLGLSFEEIQSTRLISRAESLRIATLKVHRTLHPSIEEKIQLYSRCAAKLAVLECSNAGASKLGTP